MQELPYEYEHLIIDNASTDGSVEVLRELAARDKRVKVILNTRNFGHIRSPFYGLLQAKGDAVIAMSSDLQDPPERISDFLAKVGRGLQGGRRREDPQPGASAVVSSCVRCITVCCAACRTLT